VYVADMTARITERETVLAQLQAELGVAQLRAAEVNRKMNSEARRADLAERERDLVSGRVDDAEERAAHAIVRVVELEQEIEILVAELSSMTTAWQRAESARKRA
jgi:chromosome segregation ATPase